MEGKEWIIREMENRINELLRRVEHLERRLKPIGLTNRAKMRLLEAIIEYKEFRSKRQWALYARVSMDTFYRLEREVIEELRRTGYKVEYIPLISRNGSIYRYHVRLKRI